MEHEGVLEQRLEFFPGTADDELEAPELAELAHAAPVEVSPLDSGLGGVGGLPAVGHVEHRRIDALDQRRSTRLRQHRDGRDAEEVGVVEGLLEHLRHEQAARLPLLAFGDQQIGERGFVRSDEAGDADAGRAADEDRRGTDQAAVAAGDDDREPGAAAEVPPPLHEPAVEQEGARPRHRQNQGVPLRPDRLQRVDRLEGLQGMA